MRFAHSMFMPGGDDWSWSMYSETSIDLCFQALLRDGLRVAPFDQHPDGDNSLRAVGLDAAMWRRWLGTVIDAHAQLQGAVSVDDRGQPEVRAITDLAEAFFEPWRLCPGPTALQGRLQALHTELEAAAGAQRSGDPASWPDVDLHQRLLSDGGAQIWRGLLPFHDRLSTLNVYQVAYPAPAVLTIPPLTCVIAPAKDRDGFARQVISAGAELAAG